MAKTLFSFDSEDNKANIQRWESIIELIQAGRSNEFDPSKESIEVFLSRKYVVIDRPYLEDLIIYSHLGI